MNSPEHSVVLSLVKQDDLYSKLEAGFDAEGNLVLSGHDIGESVERFFGRDEYEYWMVVPAQETARLASELAQFTGQDSSAAAGLQPFVTATLKALYSSRLQPAFSTSSDFRKWANDRGFEVQFSSWP